MINLKNAYAFEGDRDAVEPLVKVHYRDERVRVFHGVNVWDLADEIRKSEFADFWLLGNQFETRYLHKFHVQVSERVRPSVFTAYGSLHHTPLPSFGKVVSLYRHYGKFPVSHLYMQLVFTNHVVRVYTNNIDEIAEVERYVEPYRL